MTHIFMGYTLSLHLGNSPKTFWKGKTPFKKNLKCEWTNILFFILERSNLLTTIEAGWVTAQRYQWVASLVHHNWKPHLPHSYFLFSLKGFLLVWPFSDLLKNDWNGRFSRRTRLEISSAQSALQGWALDMSTNLEWLQSMRPDTCYWEDLSSEVGARHRH